MERRSLLKKALLGIPVLALSRNMTFADSQPGSGLNLDLRGVKSQAGLLRHSRKNVKWVPSQTAIVICDMWDDHWCKGAAKRVAEMAPELNRVVTKARSQGITIIHAPSSTVDFYKGTTARKNAQNAPYVKPPVKLSEKERWGTKWCWPEKSNESDMPIDDSDMGCDCASKCEIREAWTRQIKTIEIKNEDFITHDGNETYNILTQKGIKNVILCGVHLNMCVLGRPFGIRQMVNLKNKNVALMRDFTDTMYNSRMKPYVDHFTGTDLVVQHIERYWCPSFLSTDLTGKKSFRFKEDLR